MFQDRNCSMRLIGCAAIVANDGPQIEGRIEAAQLGCTDEAVERCRSLSTGISFHEPKTRYG
jgi:hypothetical protein